MTDDIINNLGLFIFMGFAFLPVAIRVGMGIRKDRRGKEQNDNS